MKQPVFHPPFKLVEKSLKFSFTDTTKSDQRKLELFIRPHTAFANTPTSLYMGFFCHFYLKLNEFLYSIYCKCFALSKYITKKCIFFPLSDFVLRFVQALKNHSKLPLKKNLFSFRINENNFRLF